MIQWNVQGLTTSKQDLVKLVDELKPCVIAVQETWQSSNFVNKFGGYCSLVKEGHFNRRYHGGVAMYIHGSLPYEELSINTPLQVVAARIQVGHRKLVTFASIYIPGSYEVTKQQILAIINQLPRPMVIMGDFNAHSGQWGRGNWLDQRGRVMEDILVNQELNCLNDGSPTHISGTAIDITVVSPTLALDMHWSALPSVLSSDHYPIVFTITSANRETRDQPERYNFKKGNWKEYREDRYWKEVNPEPQNAEHAVEQLYKQLYEMRNKWVPKYKQRKYYAKPWWTPGCSVAWHERERCYRRYKETRTMEDKIKWKKARALTTRMFKEAKRENWKDFTNTLNRRTNSSKVWETINKIRGKPPIKIPILHVNNKCISIVTEIANAFAAAFESISNEANYSKDFLDHKDKVEKKVIEFTSKNDEPYNMMFQMQELQGALDSCAATAPGPDEVSNLMLKNMPQSAKDYMLKVFNMIWRDDYFCKDWRVATIIPILKPGKSRSDPLNYRPISLTSCVCKLYEKMINNRLIEFLENNKLLAGTQCGFRRNRATIDQLVRLDTYIRKGMAEGRSVISVFFDLEKAYDLTWRYGILKDLYDLGLRGRLPCFVRNFLREREFQVRVSTGTSEMRKQAIGVPQGSTLSVTLFAVKINSLAKQIPQHIFSSLFVDDLQIAYSDPNIHDMQTELQQSINAIASWADTNGFRFSTTKTTVMHFSGGVAPVLTPKLHLKGKTIPVSERVKFLGLYWDPKLNWSGHIDIIRGKCLRDLNLLRTVSSEEWGADGEVLMRLYRAVIRPKIDYGCQVYGAASNASLKRLDGVANEAMRISAGAFKSTPVNSLRILTNEPELQLRRKEMMLRYYFKLKCHFLNPAYNSIVNQRLEMFFATRRYTEKPIICRMRRIIEEYGIPTRPVLPFKTPTKYSWTVKLPDTNLQLANMKKCEVPDRVWKSMYEDML